MNILRKLNGAILLMLSGAILTTTITSCKKSDSGGGTTTPKPTIASFTPTSGALGAEVTITGTNLTGATSVKFGVTAAASYTVVNSTTIKAVVDKGTTGVVEVTTPNGVAKSTATFTYSNVNENKITGKVFSDAELTKLKSTLIKGGLSTKLSDAGPYTLLAPVDAIFTAFQLNPASLDAGTCELVLAYHTIDGKYLSSDVPSGAENLKVLTIATTNNPQDSVFVTKLPSGDIYVNGVSVDAAKKDILADNGVIHKLNNETGFLFPPFKDAVDYIYTPSTSANGLDSLAKAIKRAGTAFPGGLTAFENVLKNNVVSIIAPTNKAFQEFFAGQPTFKKIDDWTPGALLGLLGDHLILGRKFLVNIAFATSAQGGGTGVNNYDGVPIKLAQTTTSTTLYLNPSKASSIVVPDIMILNGAVQKVGQIMFR